MFKLTNLSIKDSRRIKVNVQAYYYMIGRDQTFHMAKFYTYEFDLLV